MKHHFQLFITSASKTSPLTQQSNEKEMDFFGSLRKRDESISKYSNSKTKITSDDEAVVRRKSAVSFVFHQTSILMFFKYTLIQFCFKVKLLGSVSRATQKP